MASVPAGKLVVRNLGLVLSGDIAAPILDADTIVAVDGRITAIGRAKDLDTEGATTTIDAHGSPVAPGLIDSHVHPVAGDWTPRQSQMNWIESTLHGGRHHHDFGRRGPYAGPSQGHRGAEGHGDLRAARLHGLPSRRT